MDPQPTPGPVATNGGGGAPAAPPPNPLLTPNPGEVQIATLSFSQTVQGVSLTTPVSVFIALETQAPAVQVDVRLLVDLSDLQRKIGTLIDTVPLPRDNCNHFGTDNLVVTIWGKQITVDGADPALVLHGDVDVWACVKNPVPCTRIVWDETQFLGRTISTPRVETFDCNDPVKTQVVNQPFDATVPFHLAVTDPHTVAIELGAPAATLGGIAGGFTAAILKLVGVDINGRVKEALDGAVGPGLLQQSLPAPLQLPSLAISQAGLVNSGGELTAAIKLAGAVDAATVAALVQLFHGSA